LRDEPVNLTMATHLQHTQPLQRHRELMS